MIDHPAAKAVVAAALGIALAGCSMGTLNGLISEDTAPDPAPTAATRGPAPSVNMAGRWVLADPAGGRCGMNFVAPPGANGGPIAPEGNCPGKFFTSRQWALERNAVVIRNHAGETLAQLNIADQSRLEGQSTSGEQVTLTR
jgi:Protease inhibitor Inh